MIPKRKDEIGENSPLPTFFLVVTGAVVFEFLFFAIQDPDYW